MLSCVMRWTGDAALRPRKRSMAAACPHSRAGSRSPQVVQQAPHQGGLARIHMPQDDQVQLGLGP